MRDRNCTACELHVGVRNVCIPGRIVGDYDGVMVLGQSPGWHEDGRDEPFVGPSHDLLMPVLEKAGIVSYLKTNAVRCYPGSTKIQHVHIKACSEYLEEELETFKPKFILALGNEAIQRVLGRGRITEIAGQETWSKKYSCWVMPALHPAAILRNPNGKSSWELDIMRFGRLVRGDVVAQPPVKVHPILDDRQLDFLINTMRMLALMPGAALSYDFEATPIPWWYKDFRALTISFSSDGINSYALPLRHRESPFTDADIRRFFDGVRDVMTTAPIARVPHNGVYDDPVWFRTGGYLPIPTFDTMLASHVIDENQPKGLKWQGRARLGWPNWGIDTKNLDSQPLRDMLQYNGYDAAATCILYSIYLADLRRQPDLYRYFMQLTMRSMLWTEHNTIRGLHVNEEHLLRELYAAQELRTKAAAKIPVKNPGSPQQVAEWLYQRVGLKPPKFTATGQGSTDEETINRLARLFPEARDVLAYRKPNKKITTYFVPALDGIKNSYDGRLHPDVHMEGTETGRKASSFHTTPRDETVRSIYDAPPGWTLASSDYAQLEARLAAWRAVGCPSSVEAIPEAGNMLRAFLEGRDVYKETAGAILARPVDAISALERQNMGKVPTLAMIYRISAEGFREYAWKEYELDLTKAKAEHMHRTFYQLWWELPRWHERESLILKQRGWTKTAIGRMRRLPNAMASDWKTSEAGVREGINAPIQGLAHEINQAAGIALDRIMPEEEAYTVGDVHDSILSYIRDDCVEKWAPIIVGVMERAPQLLRPLGLEILPGLIRAELVLGSWGKGIPLKKWREARAEAAFASV